LAEAAVVLAVVAAAGVEETAAGEVLAEVAVLAV